MLNNEKGSVLIVVLVLLVSVLMLLGGIESPDVANNEYSFGYLQMLLSDFYETHRNYLRVVAINLAEAGVDRAIDKLNDDGWDSFSAEYYDVVNNESINYDSLTDSERNINKRFWVCGYNATVNPDNANIMDIVGIGYVKEMFIGSEFRFNVSRKVTVSYQKMGFFTYSIFAKDWIKMASNALTDSYNSQNEPNYAPNPNDVRDNNHDNGHVGTNAITEVPPDDDYAIDIASNADIYGDAYVGPNGDPLAAIEDETNVNGDSDALDEELDLPAQTPPSQPSYYGGSITDDYEVNQDVYFDSITLGNNETLTINANLTNTVYVTGDVTLDKGHIDITGTGSVDIYVVGTVTMETQAQINISSSSEATLYVGPTDPAAPIPASPYFVMDSNTASVNNSSKDPSRFMLIACAGVKDPGDPETNPAINFLSNNAFYGTIYAPSCGFLLNSNSDLYGAIAAKTIQLDSNAEVHYDENLINDTDIPGDSELTSTWKEEQLAGSEKL